MDRQKKSFAEVPSNRDDLEHELEQLRALTKEALRDCWAEVEALKQEISEKDDRIMYLENELISSRKRETKWKQWLSSALSTACLNAERPLYPVPSTTESDNSININTAISTCSSNDVHSQREGKKLFDEIFTLQSGDIPNSAVALPPPGGLSQSSMKEISVNSIIQRWINEEKKRMATELDDHDNMINRAA